jgi:hypothetical protein
MVLNEEFMLEEVEITQVTPGFSNYEFKNQLFKGHVPLNPKGHFDILEMTLVPMMQGIVLEEHTYCGLDVLKVQFTFYKESLYVLKEHTKKVCKTYQFERPSKQTIIDRLKSCIGKYYLWGGNFPKKTVSLYSFCEKMPKDVREKRVIDLDGIDCSGLIFYASNYTIPRNTAELNHFGEPLSLTEPLRPLDLILTKGHVRIVLDEKTVIQSRQNRGVYLSQLSHEIRKLDRKNSLRDSVSGAHDYCIRRWI